MPQFLKGNYKVETKIEDKGNARTRRRVEKKASRARRSICFVSKKSLSEGEAQPKASRAEYGRRTAKARHDARAGAERPDGTGKKDRRALEAATFDRVAPSGSPMPSAIGRGSRAPSSTCAKTQLGAGQPRSSWARDRASTGAGASIACAPHLPGHHRGRRRRAGACLRAGVVPHVVVSVDPHPDASSAVRGSGADGGSRDDYFRRQEWIRPARGRASREPARSWNW